MRILLMRMMKDILKNSAMKNAQYALTERVKIESEDAIAADDKKKNPLPEYFLQAITCNMRTIIKLTVARQRHIKRKIAFAPVRCTTINNNLIVSATSFNNQIFSR
jgi:hypothetical protein